MARGRAARRPAGGGELIQAPRPARVAIAVGAVAAYGGVAADVLLRAGSVVTAFVPSLAAGAILLVVALVFGRATLGAVLWLAGGTYVAFLATRHPRIDGTVPLVAFCLLLCTELAAWSLDERWRIRTEGRLLWRRGRGIVLLALGGAAAATVVIALTAVPPRHGVVLTLAGAAAAVGAAGAGIVLARR